MRILLVDNYDSFTYNLYQLIGSFDDIVIDVYRNDEITLEQIINSKYDTIVLSPGPGNPENDSDFGVCRPIIEELKSQVPILGVCLGHQGIGFLLNAEVTQAGKIVHGKTSTIIHDGKALFKDIPNGIAVARYHSLIINRETLPDGMIIAAETSDDEIMAIRHETYPLYGVQFHPESFMTQFGKEMIENFLELVKTHQSNLIEV